MLDLFHTLAVRLHWLKPFSLFVMLAFGALFAYAALSQNAPERLFTSGLAGLCWGLLLFMFVSLFQEIPERGGKDDSFWKRTGLFIRRLGYGVLGLATIAITIAVVIVTVRIL